MREYSAYEESHIVTSRHSIRDSAGGDFQIPADAEVETKHHCVVYDSCTESLSDKESKYALGSHCLNFRSPIVTPKSANYHVWIVNCCIAQVVSSVVDLLVVTWLVCSQLTATER